MISLSARPVIDLIHLKLYGFGVNTEKNLNKANLIFLYTLNNLGISGSIFYGIIVALMDLMQPDIPPKTP